MARIVEIGALTFYEPRLRQKRGHYYMRFYEPEMHPKQKEVALHTRDKTIAEHLFQQRRLAYFHGQYDPWRDKRIEGVTLDEALEEYLHDQDVRESTRKAKRVRIGPFADKHPGMLMSGVTMELVKEYCQRPSLKRATQQRYLYELRHFFEYCHDQGWISSNPAAEIIRKIPRRRKRQTEKVVEYLTVAQYQLLIETIENDIRCNPLRKDRIILVEIIQFAVMTGLRLGEICRLRWIDIVLADGRASNKAGCHGWILVRNTHDGETKTGDEGRVPIVMTIAAQLHRLRSSTTSPYVFSAIKSDRAIQPWWVSNRFRQYRRKAGLSEHIHFHSLRHTCASWLAEQGVPMLVIKDILRHTNLKQTLRYSHLNPESIAREMEKGLSFASNKLGLSIHTS